MCHASHVLCAADQVWPDIQVSVWQSLFINSCLHLPVTLGSFCHQQLALQQQSPVMSSLLRNLWLWLSVWSSLEATLQLWFSGLRVLREFVMMQHVGMNEALIAEGSGSVSCQRLAVCYLFVCLFVCFPAAIVAVIYSLCPVCAV